MAWQYLKSVIIGDNCPHNTSICFFFHRSTNYLKFEALLLQKQSDPYREGILRLFFNKLLLHIFMCKNIDNTADKDLQ